MKTTGPCPPHTFLPCLASSSIYPHPRTPTSIWLLYVFIERRPPKANAPSISLFLMWLQNLSQTMEPAITCANPALDAYNEPIESDDAMIWGRRCPIHGERAKLLDRAVAAAHVDCCVLCVVCVFVVVFSVWDWLLATILVESKHRPRQNGQLLQAHNTKLAIKHPKYGWMYKLIIIQRCCTHFDFLLAKLCGPFYEPAKKLAKIC